MIIDRVLASTYAVQRWRDAQFLIIDEVSMISGDFFDMLDQVARAARRRPELPFGGLQLVLCGDFCQLGPAKIEKLEYAFEAAAWDETVQHHFCLTEVKRQEGDQDLIDILGQVRMGQMSDGAKDSLARCTRTLSNDNGVLPTRLYCTNRDVDAENARELAKLQGDVHTFVALDQGPKQLLHIFSKGCSAPQELELKVGAQIVLTKRLEDKLVNGSRGVVKAFSAGGLPVVAFDNGLQKEIPPMKWEGGMDKNLFREQIPLRLAWALTVHRCQGMTLDKVECSLAEAFAPGQIYVALSRVRTMAGLQMQSFDISKARVSPKVAAFYSSSRFDLLSEPTSQEIGQPHSEENGSLQEHEQTS